MQLRIVIVCVLLACAGLFLQFHKDSTQPLPQSFDNFPVTAGEWRTVGSQHFDKNIIEVLRPTDYLYRRYVNHEGQLIDLYIGYHDGGQGAGPVHSPKNCLPGGGWNLESRKSINLHAGDEDIRVVRSLYMKGGVKVLLIYWYQVAGNIFDSELGMKAGEITASILNRRRDTALVRLSIIVPEGAGDDERVIVDFVSDFYRHIKNYLPAKSK